MYYSSEEYFKKKFDDSYRPFSFRSTNSAEYAKWKNDFRFKLKNLLGFDKMSCCALEPKSLGVEKMDGYTREKMIIHTEPGIEMTFYLLKPDNAKPGEKLPVIIAPHGHGSNGKSAVCGDDKGSQLIKDTIKRYNYTYGIEFAKRGFMVLAPDARGFGERMEKYVQNDPEKVLASSCTFLNSMANPLGLCVTGMWTWDLIRLTDYVFSRDDTDKNRVNCGGLSGGGLQTLWLAAMDERVKNVIISGYFYGYKQSILEMQCCSCNYVPGLWENADIGDICSLIANRGVFIETGDIDDLNGKDGLNNIYPQLEIVKKAARLFNNEENIVHHVFNGPHKWCGEKSVPWMVKRNF